ncbi:GNAT family N-acetyltransferase [Eisenbergiella porci]|uniref:GNAT family N-acetyltransferase n=1 Tax=Eisenbergiella TaxID=1432051 RepID=UPI003A8DEE63
MEKKTEVHTMLVNQPLLLQACLDGKFGTIFEYGRSCVCEAGFIYLLGEAEEGILSELKNRWNNRMFICMTRQWEEALLTSYPEMVHVTRYQMKYEPGSTDEKVLCRYIEMLPHEYKLTMFDRTVFEQKPFMHASTYSSYKDFQRNASGAVVWYQGQIVSSASSFLSWENQLELDIVTAKEHRRKGLGIACASAMLLDCKARGLDVHWDAQNPASRSLAEKMGYRLDCTYRAYSFMAPEEP